MFFFLPLMYADTQRLSLQKSAMPYSGGGDNQIRSELLLYQTAKSSGSYDYYHMISGADLPIKDNEYINDYFEKNNGKEFMTFFDRKPEEIIDRVRYRYFFIDLKQNRLLQHINSLSLTFQRKFHIIRHIPEDIILKKGEGWCTLTSKAVDYILANKHLIKKYFSNSFIGIEVYKQTLLWNSPYRKNISEAGNLTLILWPERNNPHPHVFNASDTELLRNNSALYARKFSKDFMFEP